MNGMRTFRVVWLGQLVSVLGSGLTSFALGIWVFLETGSVTAFALISLAVALPGILMAPVAGTYVDRWDRRVTMLIADLVSGLATATMAIIFLTTGLEVWQIYVHAVVVSLASSFQEPAYMAALPTLVHKDKLSQANGQVQLGQAIGTLISPALAGVLLVTLGLGGIMLIDFVTFLFAVGSLAVVRFPSVRDEADADEEVSFWSEAMEGWRYLRSRRGMIALLLIFSAVNFSLSIVMVLFPPMMLRFTTEQVLGFTVSAAGVGMVLGSVLMSTWKGAKSKIAGLLWPIAAGGLAIVVAGLRPSAWLVGLGGFLLMLAVPIASASSQVLWQTKVPLDLQGRTFSIRRVFATGATPLSYVAAGPLADQLFEPWLAEGGALADTAGRLVGTGPGRGIGFLFVVLGLSVTLMALSGFAYEPVRNLEQNIPDAVQLPEDGEPDLPDAASVSRPGTGGRGTPPSGRG